MLAVLEASWLMQVMAQKHKQGTTIGEHLGRLPGRGGT